MQHIKNLMAKRLQQAGLAGNVETALVIEEFNNLLQATFGDQVKKRISPVYIKNKILRVVCLSSVMVQELSLKKDYFISAINKKFHKEVIKDIKFSI